MINYSVITDAAFGWLKIHQALEADNYNQTKNKIIRIATNIPLNKTAQKLKSSIDKFERGIDMDELEAMQLCWVFNRNT